MDTLSNDELMQAWYFLLASQPELEAQHGALAIGYTDGGNALRRIVMAELEARGLLKFVTAQNP